MNILDQSKAEWFRNSKPRFEKDFNMISLEKNYWGYYFLEHLKSIHKIV